MPTAGEPVLDRGLRLLSVFGERGESLTLTQLAARAGYAKSTTSRLAARLVAWGALERRSDGRFVIGLRLLEIASLAPRGHGLRAVALPYLEDLHHAVGQHVILAVPDADEAVLVEQLSTHDADGVRFGVGSRLPLVSTAPGLVVLAHRSDPVFPDAPDPAALRSTLADVRTRGLAVLTPEERPDIVSIAAPVFDHAGAVAAVLGVVGPSVSLRTPTIAPALIAVCRAMSRDVVRSRATEW